MRCSTSTRLSGVPQMSHPVTRCSHLFRFGGGGGGCTLASTGLPSSGTARVLRSVTTTSTLPPDMRPVCRTVIDSRGMARTASKTWGELKKIVIVQGGGRRYGGDWRVRTPSYRQQTKSSYAQTKGGVAAGGCFDTKRGCRSEGIERGKADSHQCVGQTRSYTKVLARV